MNRPRIDIPDDELVELCRRHLVRQLSLCGSILRGDFGPDSDVDVLIEFDPDVPAGFRIFRVEDELSELFGGRKVDIVDPKYINRRLNNRVLHSAQVQYEQG